MFVRGVKLNTALVFILESQFMVPRNMRLNVTCYFISKIPNKRELQQTALNHSSDIKCKHFMNLCKEPFSFLVNDTSLPSDNPLRYRIIIKRLLMKKSIQFITNQNKTEFNTILTDKLLRFQFYEYGFLTGEDFFFSGKRLLEKVATIKRFEYSPSGSELKKHMTLQITISRIRQN